MIGEDIVALQRLLIVEEGFTAAQRGTSGTELAENAVEPDERHAGIVVKIRPVHIAAQIDASRAA